GPEVSEQIASIPLEDVRQALDANEALAQAFNDLVKPFVRSADTFGNALTETDKAINGCYRVARDLEENAGLPAALKKLLAECTAQTLIAKTAADELARE